MNILASLRLIIFEWVYSCLLMRQESACLAKLMEMYLRPTNQDMHFSSLNLIERMVNLQVKFKS